MRAPQLAVFVGVVSAFSALAPSASAAPVTINYIVDVTERCVYTPDPVCTSPANEQFAMQLTYDDGVTLSLADTMPGVWAFNKVIVGQPTVQAPILQGNPLSTPATISSVTQASHYETTTHRQRNAEAYYSAYASNDYVVTDTIISQRSWAEYLSLSAVDLLISPQDLLTPTLTPADLYAWITGGLGPLTVTASWGLSDWSVLCTEGNWTDDNGNGCFSYTETNTVVAGSEYVRGIARLDPVPEPATLSLVGVGLAGAAVRRFRKGR